MFQQIFDDIVVFRGEMENWWGTPPIRDCQAYACTESAEAIDSELRRRRTKDARNRQRISTVQAELADCAIMLVSSLLQTDIDDLYLEKLHTGQNLAEINLSVAAIYNNEMEDSAWIELTCIALGLIAGYVPNLKSEIRGRLELIFHKHCTQPELRHKACPWMTPASKDITA